MRTLLITVSILLSFGGNSQNYTTDTSTTIYCNFKKGDKKTFQIKETATQYSYGFVAMKAASQYEATVQILDESEDRFTLEWTIKTLSTENKKYATYPLLANMRNGLRVQYITNKQGVPVQLLNENEVSQHLSQAYDSLTRNQSYDPINQMLIKQLPLFINSAGGIIDVYLKPILLYHSAYGGEWVLKKPIYKASKSNNAYGDEDFPVILITELNKLDTKADYAQLTIDQIVSKELAAQIMAGRIQEGIEEIKDRNVKPGELPKQIKMKDHNEFDVTLSTGWLSRVFYERITKDRDSKKVDTFEIILQ